MQTLSIDSKLGRYLMKGASSPQFYEMKSGVNLGSIAKQYIPTKEVSSFTLRVEEA